MVETFAFVGRWRGVGKVLPNIAYEEEINVEVFGTPGGKQLSYSSKTWVGGSSYQESPLHSELGMMKLNDFDSTKANIELLLVHPFGLTEVETGVYDNGMISLESVIFSRSPTSKNNNVERVRREIRIENERINYQLFLKLIDSEEYLHLEAELTKVIT